MAVSSTESDQLITKVSVLSALGYSSVSFHLENCNSGEADKLEGKRDTIMVIKTFLARDSLSFRFNLQQHHKSEQSSALVRPDNLEFIVNI